MFLLEWKGVCEYGDEASFWPGEFLMSEAHGNSLYWLEGTGVLGITEEGSPAPKCSEAHKGFT